jgi:hypothetical protein
MLRPCCKRQEIPTTLFQPRDCHLHTPSAGHAVQRARLLEPADTCHHMRNNCCSLPVHAPSQKVRAAHPTTWQLHPWDHAPQPYFVPHGATTRTLAIRIYSNYCQVTIERPSNPLETNKKAPPQVEVAPRNTLDQPQIPPHAQ